MVSMPILVTLPNALSMPRVKPFRSYMQLKTRFKSVGIICVLYAQLLIKKSFVKLNPLDPTAQLDIIKFLQNL